MWNQQLVDIYLSNDAKHCSRSQAMVIIGSLCSLLKYNSNSYIYSHRSHHSGAHQYIAVGILDPKQGFANSDNDRCKNINVMMKKNSYGSCRKTLDTKNAKSTYWTRYIIKRPHEW